LEAVRAAAEQVEDCLRGEPRADERLVHPVAGQRIDETGRIADEDRPALDRGVAGPPERQAMPAQLPHACLGDSELAAVAAQVLAEARTLRLPAADPDVVVVALREDPAVPAGDDPELDQRAAAVAELVLASVLDVALV